MANCALKFKHVLRDTFTITFFSQRLILSRPLFSGYFVPTSNSSANLPFQNGLRVATLALMYFLTIAFGWFKPACL